MTQPEALRLANSTHLAYRVGWQREAAAELRRLWSENTAAVSSFLSADDERTKLRAQRDALLEALRDLVQLEADGRTEYESAIPHWDAARAAIAKVEGENHAKNL